VAGATGNVGSGVALALSKLTDNEGDEIRCLTRSAAGENPALAALADISNAEIVECDLLNCTGLAAAFEGVDAAFLSCANFRGQVTAEKNFIDAAIASSGCRYLVKLGTVRSFTDVDSPAEYGRFHAEIEEHLEAATTDTDMKWTVLCPNWFMTNHLGDIFGTLPQAGIIAYPVEPETRMALVDTRDVGDVAAHLLHLCRGSSHHGLKLDISGPEDVSFLKIEELYTEKLGRKIQHVKCSDGDWIAGAVGAGLEEWLAEAACHNFHLMKAGEMSFESSPEVLALASPRRTMAQWINEWAPRSPAPPDE